MKVSDKMVDAAVDVYDGLNTLEPKCDWNYMKEAIETSIQSAWVKFDKWDSSTYPDYDVTALFQVARRVENNKGEPLYIDPYYAVSKLIKRDLCGDYLDGGKLVEHIIRWMPLPEYKGE